MYNLEELEQFSKKPNEILQETGSTKNDENIPPSNGNNIPANDNIPSDFFNSAGNTKLEDEDSEDNQKTDEPNTERPKGKVTLGKVISGKATVNIINMFIPSFIVFALSKFGYNANKRQFKLTQEEKDIMSPVVQDCLDYISIDFANPFYALAFISVMIYGSKAFDAIPDLKKMKDSVDEEDFEEENENSIGKKPVMSVVPTVAVQYQELREKLESTSIRREKNRLIIEALEEAAPEDIIAAWKVYSAIFPERNENYFNKWYSNNIELFPDSLRFNKKDDLENLE